MAGRFGAGKKKVKLADTATVLRLIGYPAGGVPPFGHAARVPVLLDAAVQRWEVVYGGGGDDPTLLRIAAAELARSAAACDHRRPLRREVSSPEDRVADSD